MHSIDHSIQLICMWRAGVQRRARLHIDKRMTLHWRPAVLISGLFFFFFFLILAKLSWQPQACLDKCYTWGCANKWNQWISLFWLLIFSSKMIQSHADLLQAASVGKWNLCSVGQALCQHTGCCFSTIKQELCHTSHLITGFFRGLGWIRAPSQWLTVRGPFDRLHLQSHLKVMLAGPQWRRRRA